MCESDSRTRGEGRRATRQPLNHRAPNSTATNHGSVNVKFSLNRPHRA
jgi:hypothetical protein